MSRIIEPEVLVLVSVLLVRAQIAMTRPVAADAVWGGQRLAGQLAELGRMHPHVREPAALVHSAPSRSLIRHAALSSVATQPHSAHAAHDDGL